MLDSQEAGIRFGDNFLGDGQYPTIINSLAGEKGVTARVARNGPNHRIGEIAAEQTFVLSYLLAPSTNGSLWLDNRPTQWHPVKAGEFHVFNLADRIRAAINEPHEFVYIYLPATELDHFADEHNIPKVNDRPFRSGDSLADPTIAGVSQRLLPMIADGPMADRLLLSELFTKLQLQFLHRFAPLSGRSVAYIGGLSPWRERRAKALLDACVIGGIPIARLASECGMSRSHFLQAFRQTTGVTPHQWLLGRRVELSKRFLACSSLSLTEIALACGFAHHPHFSRVFCARVGMPPGAWRAQNLKSGRDSEDGGLASR